MSSEQAKMKPKVDEKYSVTIESAGLQEVNDNIVLTGILSAENCSNLKVDDYQREAGFSTKKIAEIQEAMMNGENFQAITLGVRSQDYTPKKDNAVLLPPETYLIDGLQRFTAYQGLLKMDKVPKSKLPVTVYFGTTHEAEVRMFQDFNMKVTRVSPDKLLANFRFSNKNVERLIIHTQKDNDFVWKNKVSWGQNTRVGDLIKGRKYLINSLLIHSRFGTVPTKGSIEESVAAFNKIADRITLDMFLLNIKNYIKFFDRTWNVSGVSQNRSRLATKGVFMELVSMIISRHKNFWTNNKLVIPEIYEQKFAQVTPTSINASEIPSTGHPSFDIAIRGTEDFLIRKLPKRFTLKPFE